MGGPAPGPVDGVAVELCLAASLDGKITSAAREPVTFTSRADRRRLHVLRDAADALLLGAATVRAEDPPLLPGDERRAARRAAGRRPAPVRAVVSRSLDLPLGRALRVDAESPVVVVAPRGAPDEAAERLRQAGHEVVLLPAERLLPAALEHLRDRHGVRDVLCEGGGALNADVLAAGLARRLHLTLCPLLIGGAHAPTPVDGDGFTLQDAPRARLERCEQVGEEVFLTYALEGGESSPGTGG